MLCPNCKTNLEPNARFCGVCGHRLERAIAPAASAGTQAPAPVKAVAASSLPRPVKKQSAPPDPFLGMTLNNRFRIDSKIGEGGFGAVYRGVQLSNQRKVALKLLHPDMTADDNLVARFRREGLVLCNLRDAHTITTYDFDQTPEGTLYIAMELLEGKSLHEVFHAHPPIEWRRMFRILAAMCSSLAEAHAQGIVHRDLKPENVYLETRAGNADFVKILDFGIAKVMRGDSIDPMAPQLTATGQTLGTLEYMSPEQLMGKPLDGRSDVYALGVVGYELITGRLPFPDAKGPAALITAQLKQTPPAPSQVAPSLRLPAAVDRVLLKCLEKDRNQRFADVTALAAALQEALAAQEAAVARPASHEPSATTTMVGGGGVPPVPVPVSAPAIRLPSDVAQGHSGEHARPAMRPVSVPAGSPVGGNDANAWGHAPAALHPHAAANPGISAVPSPVHAPQAMGGPHSPMPPVGYGGPQMLPPGAPLTTVVPVPVAPDSQRRWYMIAAVLVVIGIAAGAAVAWLT